MPNLSYQMQLVNAMQERPMQNLDALLNTAGGVFQRSEARTDEQDAINYFSQKESITPEDLQDFSANHPRMPVVDVWKYAGAIGTQKKAQRLKDQFKTIQGAMKSAYDNGEEFDMAQIATLFPNGIEPELVQRLKEYKSLYPEAKILEMEPGKVYQRTIGGKPIGDPMRGPEKPIEQKYKIGEMIDNITGPDGELYQGWVGGYDENGQVKFDKLVKKAEKTEKGKVDKVKVYGANGNLVRLATPEPDGTITLKPGETTQEPRGTSLLTPAEEAQRIRISKASREEAGLSVMPTIPGGSVPGELNNGALEGATAGEKAIVKQLVEYKLPLPSGFALKSPYWQNIMQRAALYDPSFDASQYNVRLKLRNDFNSGKAAQNIRSLNTAVAHLDELDKAAKGLNNAPVQLWNKVVNFGLTQAGDSRVTKFLSAATAVEGELANVFKNTGATDQEIKAWRANLDTSQSPKQLKDNIDTVISLLGGRLGALQNQWETGMGKPKGFKMLSDKSRAILTRIGVDVNAIDPAKKEGAANAPNAEYKVGNLYQGKKIIGINRDTKQLNVEGLGVVSY